jgi:hypothetical protein
MAGFFDAIADPRVGNNLGLLLKNFTQGGRNELDQIAALNAAKRGLETQQAQYAQQQLGSVAPNQSQAVVDQLRNAFTFDQERGASNILNGQSGPGAFQAKVAQEGLRGATENRYASEDRRDQGWAGLIQQGQQLDDNYNQNQVENRLRNTGQMASYAGSTAGFGMPGEKDLNTALLKQWGIELQPPAPDPTVQVFRDLAAQAKGGGQAQGDNSSPQGALMQKATQFGNNLFADTIGGILGGKSNNAPTPAQPKASGKAAAKPQPQAQTAPTQPHRTLTQMMQDYVDKSKAKTNARLAGPPPERNPYAASPDGPRYVHQGTNVFQDLTPIPKGMMPTATGKLVPRLPETVGDVMAQPDYDHLDEIRKMIQQLMSGGQ